MDQQPFTTALLDFLGASPTPFHAVRNLAALLGEHGFAEISEQDDWGQLPPGRYFIRRNDSSLVALVLATDSLLAESGLRMAGAHTDSPGLKIKPSPAQVNHSLLQLGVETYGGALLTPWFDRDLSIAGRVIWQDKAGSVHTSLLDFKRPVAVIPSLAIHLNREANDQKPVNKQTDLVPIIMQAASEQDADFSAILAEELLREHHGAGQAKILDHELILYDCQPPALIGIKGEFLAGGRLDNLLSCYALVLALIKTEGRQNCLVVLNDHEEVGSMSASGAQGPFLQSVLERLIPDASARQRCLIRSLFISADNAHAVHPNFADRHDKGHLPRMNFGPVIKYNAGQRYATSSRSGAFYRLLAERAGIPVQEFVMRSDLTCGSTLGPITAAGLGVTTIDIGAPTLAMHSVRELAGAMDPWYLARSLQAFFATAADDPVWRCLA
jgi:aspartyl aminopeptidase